MSYGLENRSPFLNNEIVNFAYSIPMEYKIKTQGKKILRNLLSDFIPNHYMSNNKRGFLIPLKEWLSNDLYEWANHLLSKEKLEHHMIYNPDKVLAKWKNLKNNVNMQEVYSLWDVIIFQNWYYRRGA